MPENEIDLKVEQHHKTMYAENVAMVAQQNKSHIRGAVTEVSASGETMSVSDLVGKVEAEEVDGRDRRNMDNRPKNTRRWLVFPPKIKSGQYVDSIDKMKMAMDPMGMITRSHTSGVIRRIDQRILGVRKDANGVYRVDEGGVLGSATEGKRGGEKSTLPASCYTAAGGTGLTLEKLIGAIERLKSDEFGMEDDDPMYAAISPADVTDLLEIALATKQSLNAFDVEALKTGKPTGLMGLTWIVSNIQAKDGTDRLIPIWSKRNVIAGFWQDVRGRMWSDTSADDTPYCVVDAYVDATRAEDLGVHVIKAAA